MEKQMNKNVRRSFVYYFNRVIQGTRHHVTFYAFDKQHYY